MVNKDRKIIIILISTTFFTLFMFGCNDTVTDEYYVEYISDYFGGDDNTISLIDTDIDGEYITLGVVADHITNGSVHSVYFDLIYRDDIMTFQGFESGDFWGSELEVVYQIGLDPHNSERLIAGISVLGSGVVENGDGVLVYLRFKAVSEGICPFWFENYGLKDNSGSEGEYITGVSWYGGHATVSR